MHLSAEFDASRDTRKLQHALKAMSVSNSHSGIWNRRQGAVGGIEHMLIWPRAISILVYLIASRCSASEDGDASRPESGNRAEARAYLQTAP
jgi:hypothetical protein